MNEHTYQRALLTVQQLRDKADALRRDAVEIGRQTGEPADRAALEAAAKMVDAGASTVEEIAENAMKEEWSDAVFKKYASQAVDEVKAGLDRMATKVRRRGMN